MICCPSPKADGAFVRVSSVLTQMETSSCPRPTLVPCHEACRILLHIPCCRDFGQFIKAGGHSPVACRAGVVRWRPGLNRQLFRTEQPSHTPHAPYDSIAAGKIPYCMVMSLAGSGGSNVSQCLAGPLVVMHVLGEPNSPGPSREPASSARSGQREKSESGVERASPSLQMSSPPFQPTLVRRLLPACLAQAPCGPGWGKGDGSGGLARDAETEKEKGSQRETRDHRPTRSIYLAYYVRGPGPGIHRSRVQVVWGPKPGQSAREASLGRPELTGRRQSLFWPEVPVGSNHHE